MKNVISWNGNLTTGKVDNLSNFMVYSIKVPLTFELFSDNVAV